MTDKSSIQQILGALMQRPQLLSEIDKYVLMTTDFSTRFEKYIFSAISGLYQQGATHIEPIDVANFLETDSTAKKNFEINNGVEYLQDILDYSSVENFPYYYNRLKKINLLRDLKKQGFDISDFYCDDLTNVHADEINQRFEHLSLKDICDGIKRKVLGLEAAYVKTGEIEVKSAAEGMREFLKELGEEVSIGPAVQGAIYNQIIGGAERGALTIRSASSGLGKALPNYTKVPTPLGWRRVGDIKAGDYLFGRDGKRTRVLQVFPQPSKKTVYQVLFKSGRIAECCEEHLWSYYPASDDYKLNTASLAEIIWDASNNGFYEGECPRFRVPVAQSVEMPEHSINLSPQAVEKMIAEGHIPEDYLFSSKRQRMQLLRGLMDVNGEICVANGRVCLSASTRSFAEDLMALSGSLGILFRLKERRENCYIEFIIPDCLKKTLFGSQEKKMLLNAYPRETEIDFTTDAIIGINKAARKEEMTCFLVDNEEHLFIAGGSWWVTHNTRLSVADACYLAYPLHYDDTTRKWAQTGSCEKVLFVITEQTFPQINKMILAYLSDINESRFKLGHFTDDEEKRLNTAVDIMERFTDNFTIIKIPAPSIELTKTLIREQCLTRDISCVFFDYIFINPELLREFKGSQLRNDELLLLFSTALKDLAVELDVAMFTSTQVNASADDSRNIRNEASLAGGRSTINKADNGAIMARPTPEELETLAPIIDKYGRPNIVTDIFKVRSGEWSQVRIWSQANLGTMKRKDLFITDARLNIVEGFVSNERYEVQNWSDKTQEEIISYVQELNTEETV